MAKIKNIKDVVQFQLCSGCGICAFMEPERFVIKDVLEYGRRPFLKNDKVEENGDALKVCPGINLEHTFNRQDPKLLNNLLDSWGPIYDVMEGYASDKEIRFSGSSGGVVTGLALYCLEKGGMGSVLHTAARKDKPYLNETVLSKSREELLATTGSRYSPSSPCDRLGEIDKGDERIAFIGKPCDVAAVQRARKLKSNLDKNLGITISFFCAGVPSTEGTLKLLKREGVTDPETISSLRYRGLGWPGKWVANFKNKGEGESKQYLSYAESWGFLQQYRQWRCYICPDHSGEFADISIGDPWYRETKLGELGKSLIVVRTQRGQELLNAAIDSGYIVAEKSDSSLLPRSQPNMLNSRNLLWGRLLALRFSAAAVPNYRGFQIIYLWWYKLSGLKKVRSILGTIKRVFRKGLYKRII